LAFQEDPVSAPEEGGVSLTVEGETAALLRKRAELPARTGRYFLWLLGAVVAGGGGAFWFTTRSLLGIGLVAFGAVLLALGFAQGSLLRRDLEHWPDQAFLHDSGVELVLHNGEIRAIDWTEPTFTLSLISKKAPKPIGREFRLIWSPDPKIPAVQISEAGWEQVQKAAQAHELDVSERRLGGGLEATRWVIIRQNEARRPPKVDKVQAAKEAKEAKKKQAAEARKKKAAARAAQAADPAGGAPPSAPP
jgi:hypothetical protein